MPKEHSDCAGFTSPFPSSNSQSGDKESPVLATCTAGGVDAKEWEDVICPVCLDTPHNAVLLLCSSHENGCRPYMCNTGHRYSNCLNCFRGAFAAKSPSTTAATNSHESSHSVNRGDMTENNTMLGTREEALYPVDDYEREDKKVLTCPLCRGKIRGWIVVEGARRFMDTRPRPCTLESCGFSGTYRELRLHVRVEHPLACPSKVDPNREHSWTMLERQHQLADMIGAHNVVEDGHDGEWDVMLRSDDWEHSWTMLERQHHLADMVGAHNVVADGHDGQWDVVLRSNEDYGSFLTISLLGLFDPSVASDRLTASTRVGLWTRRLRRRMATSNQEGLPGYSNERETHGGGVSSSDGSVVDLSTSIRTSGRQSR